MNQRLLGAANVQATPQRNLTLSEARRAARDSGQYLLWLDERQAAQFQEPGWIEVESPRKGGVPFLHPQREIRFARRRGIL